MPEMYLYMNLPFLVRGHSDVTSHYSPMIPSLYFLLLYTLKLIINWNVDPTVGMGGGGKLIPPVAQLAMIH